MHRLSEQIRSTLSAEGGIILDVRQGRMLWVNPTGAQILERLKADTPDNKIVDELVQRYSIDAETAKRDLLEFFASLRNYHLLRRQDAEGPA